MAGRSDGTTYRAAVTIEQPSRVCRRQMEGDDASLNEPPISYMGAGSEPIPGGIRAGLARHRLAVEAASSTEAVEIVRMALGAQAADTHDWDP